MKSVLEKTKVREESARQDRGDPHPVPPVRLKHLRVKVVSGQNFRNSFTTEDADLFTKTPKLTERREVKPIPSLPPKPDVPRGRIINDHRPTLSPVGFSNSMRDLSNAEAADKTGEPKALATQVQQTTVRPQDAKRADVCLREKPKPPPKSTKIESFINAQRQQQQLHEASSPSGVPVDRTNGESKPPAGSPSVVVRGGGGGASSVSSSDSDSFEDSDVDDSDGFPHQYGSGSQCISMDGNSGFESMAQKVANELLESEKVYVRKLHLIDQVFHMEIIKRNRLERFIPDEVIPQIFSNIKCIYQFHNDYLLPELDSCIKTWDAGPKVGTVMRKAAPFFKLYTEFVTNFSNASGLIAAWIAKSEKFVLLLEELQKHPECANLTLQHHLLEPIQRVPRYQLLLTEYLKRLPENSSDKEPVEAALRLVTEAARHTDDEMKKMDKFKKLLDTCSMLVDKKEGEENLVSINRELVREGKMKKISARDGSLLDRYLFLFNDVLLVCMVLPLKIGFGQQYLVKSKLDICGMKVYDGSNEEHPNSFTIMSKQKSIEFAASCLDEKNDWVTEIWAVIKQFVDKERTKDKQFLQKIYQQTEELGKRAPTWVKDQDTSMCMLCCVAFKTFRRRHHCRACGKVVCNECSSHKLRMDFERSKLNRVCDVCYSVLESSSSSSSPFSTKIQQRRKGPAVLGMKATSEDTALSGHLDSSSDGRTWMKRWIVLHSNCALYVFKAKRDNAATESLPLPGYRVEECPPEESVRPNTFKVFHDRLPRIHYFSTLDRSFYNRWLESLRLAVVAELPTSPHPQGAHPVATSPPLGPPQMPLLLLDHDEHEIKEEEEIKEATEG